jgi:hypothetical protein
VKQRPMLAHAVRFDRHNPDICPALTWKGQFTPAEPDPTVQSVSDHQYWCVYTQTCIGPDNGLVEPYTCSKKDRACRGEAIRRNQEGQVESENRRFSAQNKRVP